MCRRFNSVPGHHFYIPERPNKSNSPLHRLVLTREVVQGRPKRSIDIHGRAGVTFGVTGSAQNDVTPMPLTDTAIRNCKPGVKPAKLFDKDGLFLLVTPSGGKWWRLKYRYHGREKLLSLGVYPDTSLTKARAKRDEARALLASDVDPSEHRRATKAAHGAENSFEAVAREWHTKFSANGRRVTQRRFCVDSSAMFFPGSGSARLETSARRSCLLRFGGSNTAEPSKLLIGHCRIAVKCFGTRLRQAAPREMRRRTSAEPYSGGVAASRLHYRSQGDWPPSSGSRGV